MARIKTLLLVSRRKSTRWAVYSTVVRTLLCLSVPKQNNPVPLSLRRSYFIRDHPEKRHLVVWDLLQRHSLRPFPADQGGNNNVRGSL